MKLIAKAPKGMEFLHSRKEAYFAPDKGYLRKTERCQVSTER